MDEMYHCSGQSWGTETSIIDTTSCLCRFSSPPSTLALQITLQQLDSRKKCCRSSLQLTSSSGCMRRVAQSSPRKAHSGVLVSRAYWNADLTTAGFSLYPGSSCPRDPCTAKPWRKIPGPVGETTKPGPANYYYRHVPQISRRIKWFLITESLRSLKFFSALQVVACNQGWVLTSDLASK